MMRYYLSAILALALVTLACNMSSAATTPVPSLPSSSTPTQQATDVVDGTLLTVPTASSSPENLMPTPTLELPSHGALVYETDFLTGWPALAGEKASGSPVLEGYQIDATESWAFYTYTSRARQATFFAEIAATPRTCPPGQGAYGLIFHYQSDTQYRFFVIWCSGRYSLFERTDAASVITLAEGNLPEGVNPASEEHILGVYAFDNKLTLYVDSRQIASVDVSSLPAGDIGPYVETTGGLTSVLFTRLSIYAPQ